MARLMRNILSVIVLMLIGAATAVASNFNVDYTNRYVLVINSYNENTPWSQSVTRPVNEFVLNNDTLYCETVHLNGAMIADSAQYAATVEKIYKRFEGSRPKGVVMIGSMAFTMRDSVQAWWGDVPMLVLTRIDKYAPTDFYFTGHATDDARHEMRDMASLRDKYNFTVIQVPDQYGPTIELMIKMQPQMTELVFLADNAWVNHMIDEQIRAYLAEKHPALGYRWVVAGDATNEQYQDYMGRKDPTKGLLMSTWTVPDNVDDDLSVAHDNMQLVSSSVNPIFCLRDAYLNIGAVGGVFNGREEVAKAIEEAMARMVESGDMSKMPFFSATGTQETIVNYQLARKFGLDLKACPPDTIFIDKPETFWHKYRWYIIGFGVCVALLLLVAFLYVKWQQRQLHLLRRHASFIKNMPWAYSRARIVSDGHGVITDIEYDLNDMNSAFLDILEANLLPNKRYKIFPFDFIAEKTRQLVETGAPVSFTYRFEKTDTYYEFLLCRIDPDALRPGEMPQYIDVFANDITPLSKADLKLQSASRTLDMTLKVSHIIPWQWNMDTRQIVMEVYRFKSKLTDEYGDEKRELLSFSEDDLLSYIHPDDAEMVKNIIYDFHSGKITEDKAEYRIFMGHDRRLEWVEINAAVTSPGMITGSLLIITERKMQELALVEAKERAAESDKLKSAFLANMSHEIRTPLNAIIGFSNMLTTTKDERRQRKFINIIEHNNQLLLHLVNDVLDLAKIESNTMELNMALTDINSIMEQVKETVQLRVPQGVMFNMVLGSGECLINTDPNRLTQVLINLLTNATKFTTKGSISFGYEEQGDELYFYVTDTGIGISKENQSKLFGRFSKLNNFAQGTGLGLAISKSIINKLGGEIGVKSRGEGKGATFWFTLPYEAVERAKEPEALPAPAAAPAKMSDVTILVAEDNPSNYILFESILADKFTLIHANDGQEAIDLFNKHHPTLVLMDIGMPNVDGMQATAEIRKVDTKVPIIAVTAFAFLSDKKKILKNGFNDYVPKPINPHDLLESIDRALNKLDVEA